MIQPSASHATRLKSKSEDKELRNESQGARSRSAADSVDVTALDVDLHLTLREKPMKMNQQIQRGVRPPVAISSP